MMQKQEKALVIPMENDLSFALSNSISEEIGNIATDILEIGLDSILDDGLLKEVPILSTAVNVFKIGKSVVERHYLKKLAAFISQLNKGIVDEKQRDYYKNTVKDHPRKRDEELEYILIIIDRYIHADKAKKLAKLYLSYLDKEIDWETFTKCSEILDRLLPGDYQELSLGFWPNLSDSEVSDSLLRLVSLGLVISHNKSAEVDNTVGKLIVPDSTVKDYELTRFGNAFYWSLID